MIKNLIKEALNKNPIAFKEALEQALAEKVKCACEKKIEDELEEGVVKKATMSPQHKKIALDVHKQLSRGDSMAPGPAATLKGVHQTLLRTYGKNWRQMAGINEEVELDESVNQLDEISKAEGRNLAYYEKQAVRAAEKANVGALSRAEKEAWIDKYIEKLGIQKGPVGSAIYSGVMKVRAQ